MRFWFAVNRLIKRGDGGAQDRYYTSIRVGTEPARYRFSFDEFENSAERDFDFSSVYQIVLSGSRSALGKQYFVDDFRLEK